MRNLLYSSVGSVDYSVSGNEAKGMCGTDFLIAQLASQKNHRKLTQNYMLLGSGWLKSTVQIFDKDIQNKTQIISRAQYFKRKCSIPTAGNNKIKSQFRKRRCGSTGCRKQVGQLKIMANTQHILQSYQILYLKLSIFLYIYVFGCLCGVIVVVATATLASLSEGHGKICKCRSM